VADQSDLHTKDIGRWLTGQKIDEKSWWLSPTEGRCQGFGKEGDSHAELSDAARKGMADKTVPEMGIIFQKAGKCPEPVGITYGGT
jgi:hypothetical protein